jgi:hypothetical protein
VESRYGVAARDVIMNLFQWGHTQVHELVRAYEQTQKSEAVPQTNGVNGSHAADKITSTQQLHKTLVQLLEAGIIEPVAASTLRSPNDTHQMLEREVLRDYRDGVKGKNGKEEVAGRIRERMRRLRSEESYWQPKAVRGRVNGEPHVNGIKKKRKLANGYSEDDDVELEVGCVL